MYHIVQLQTASRGDIIGTAAPPTLSFENTPRRLEITIHDFHLHYLLKELPDGTAELFITNDYGLDSFDEMLIPYESWDKGIHFLDLNLSYNEFKLLLLN